MKLSALAAIALIAVTTAAHAQRPVEQWRLSLFGGGQLLRHSTEITGLPGVPSCSPAYGSGSGGGVALGLAGELSLTPKLSVGLRALYQTLGASLTTNETALVTAEMDTVTATFAHSVETTHRAIGAEIVGSYDVVAGLSVIGGLRLDMITGASYSQREEILSPGTIRYENDRRTRGEYNGELEETASTQLALLAGLRYDLPLDRDGTLVLSPEVIVWQGLGDIDPDEPWRVQGLRAGVSVSYILFGSRGASPIEPGADKETLPIPGR